LVNRYDAKPTSELLADVMTSSSDVNRRIGATGPKISVWQIGKLSLTLTRIVG
jgi:hypothetical protein